MRFIRDRLMNADRKEIGKGVMRIVNNIQDIQPDVQMAVAASLFILMVNRWGENPTEVLDATDKVMRDATGLTPEFKAAELYMKHEF